VGDYLWFGADGDIFKYNTAEGELEVIDSVEGWVENMVGGANTVVVGYENSEVINTRAYDTRTGNLVAEFTDGFKMPKAVVDGKIVMKEATGGTSAYFEIWDGEYRDIGPEVSALSTEYSGIVGEELSLSVVVNTPWDAISWEITDSTGAVVAQEADVESWSLTPEFDPGATYEVVVEVVYRGESETRSAQLFPSPPPVVGTTPPRDIDDDGLYEDVTGTGDASVLDTQALFTAVDTGEIQHPELYNFSSASPDTDVTILDVAAHWRFHGAQ
jgi:hypothetical protein